MLLKSDLNHSKMSMTYPCLGFPSCKREVEMLLGGVAAAGGVRYHCPVVSTVEVKSWNNIHYRRTSGLTSGTCI